MSEHAAMTALSMKATDAHQGTNTENPEISMNPVNTSTTVATHEELSIMKFINKEEAIAYEKHLRGLTETVIRWLQEGLSTEPPLAEVMPTLIREFKTMVAKMYDLVHHASRKEIWNSIRDPKGKCLWDPEDDDGDQAAPAEAMVQQEQHAWPEAEEFIQAWDEPLTNEQALLVTDLFRSHACMLEWQEQVSMLLGKLATSVSLKLFLAILNSTVKLLHQVTLPPEVMMKLTLPERLKHAPVKEQLAAQVTPDPDYMKPWTDESATLYLAATMYYVIRKAMGVQGNMKHTATLFRVKLMGLCHCINGWKYQGGSKKATQH